MYHRKRPALTTYSRRAPPRKKSYRRQGLAPTYRGYNPRQFSRGEWKFVDTTISTTNLNTSTAVLLLNGLAPGTSASTRVGNKVMMRSIQLNVTARVIAGTGVDQVVRWGVVLDRQANGAAPTYVGIMSTNNVWGFRNLENRKRFKLLIDKQHLLNATAEPGSGRHYKIYMKFRRPIIVEFNNGVAGTIADIISNSLYLYGCGTEAVGSTASALYGYCRIRYTDM